MGATVVADGSENAACLPRSSDHWTDTACTPASLQDLLERLHNDRNAPMFRSTTNKFAEFLGKTSQDIPIEALESDRFDFRNFLRQRKYAKHSVRSYLNYMRMLTASAREFGWSPRLPTLPPQWDSIVQPTLRAPSKRLIRDLVKHGREPSSVQEDDLREWQQKEVKNGLSHFSAYSAVCEVRKRLVEKGANLQLSKKRLRKSLYGMSFDKMPSGIRDEISDVLRWKLDLFVPGRPTKAHVRNISGKTIENALRRLLGFAVNVMGMTGIVSIKEAITERVVAAYVSWALNTRGVKGGTVACDLARISAALGHNPKYSSITAGWLTAMMACIPVDSEEDLRRRKEEKYLSYEALREIPAHIRLERPSEDKASQVAIAKSVRNQLLVEWMTILPWRQRNHRECRIGGENPNLYKAPVPTRASISKPEWLQELEKTEPKAEVWQVHFTKDQTKTHHEVTLVLPRRLVHLLEEYLLLHRKHLVRGMDPGSLFLNDHGGAFTSRTFAALVCTLTLRYGGRMVTPHLFRDIYAFMWLKKMPEDYLNLSKLLWHRNIQTTIKKYGWMCNESSAMCRAEKILG